MASHGFTGQPGRRSKRGRYSQASTRRPIVLYDQHGRPWSASIENKSGMPTGLISPAFQAPWYPDQRYLLVNPDNPTELYINYPLMYRHRRAALEEYHRDAVRKATANKWEAPVRGKYEEKMLDTLGNPPKPLEPVAACMQGNPYILGETDVVDRRVTPFLNERRREVTPEELEGYDFAPETFAAAKAAGRTTAPTRKQRIAVPEDEDDLLTADFRAAERKPPKMDDFEAGDDEDDDEGEELESLLDKVETEPEEADDEDEDEDELDLDDEVDPEALGGRTVQPRKTAHARKQAPRRPTQTSVPRKTATARGTGNPTAHRSAPAKPAAKPAPAGRPKTEAERTAKWRQGRGPSLADGARPAVASRPRDEAKPTSDVPE